MRIEVSHNAVTTVPTNERTPGFGYISFLSLLYIHHGRRAFIYSSLRRTRFLICSVSKALPNKVSTAEL